MLRLVLDLDPLQWLTFRWLVADKPRGLIGLRHCCASLCVTLRSQWRAHAAIACSRVLNGGNVAWVRFPPSPLTARLSCKRAVFLFGTVGTFCSVMRRPRHRRRARQPSWRQAD